MRSTKYELRIWLTAVLFWLAAAYTGWGAYDPISRPIPEDGGPTPVYVAMGLLNVDEINSAKQNFTANLYISARWNDPRQIHEGPGDRVFYLNEIWHPQLQFLNQQKVFRTFAEIVYVEPSGLVKYAQRVWGPFSQPLDMKDFPFDTQAFTIQVAAAGLPPTDVVFETNPDKPSGISPEFSLPDWKILDWKLDLEPYHPLGADREIASFSLKFRAQRYISHYLLKIILPLVLIVIMSWIVFWIDPSESSTQIGLATTSMLTLIAYRFMVGGSIPVIPYLTRMDLFILGSTILVFLALTQAALTSIMVKKKMQTSARRTDLYCRLIFPCIFAAVVYFSMIAG
jgi:hypothetical protein